MSLLGHRKLISSLGCHMCPVPLLSPSATPAAASPWSGVSRCLPNVRGTLHQTRFSPLLQTHFPARTTFRSHSAPVANAIPDHSQFLRLWDMLMWSSCTGASFGRPRYCSGYQQLPFLVGMFHITFAFRTALSHSSLIWLCLRMVHLTSFIFT